MRRNIVAALLVLLMLLAAPVVAWADDGAGGRFVLGGSFTLSAGESLSGDLVVMGGTARLMENSTVFGNVVVFGGTVSVAGDVTQDVTVIGGSVDLQSTALVMGQVISVGGAISRAPGAQVQGDIVEGLRDLPFEIPLFFQPDAPFVFRPGVGWGMNILGGVVSAIVSTLTIMALALLAILLLPKQTEQVTSTVVSEPALSLGAGLLTMIVMPILLIVLIITCIGPLVLGLAFGIAILFGWIAVGLWLGRKILEAFKAKETTAMVEVLVGVAVISLLTRVPCIGWLLGLAVASIGLGAVILTRFGTTSYPWPTMEDVDASAAGGVPVALDAGKVTEGDTAPLSLEGDQGIESDGPAEDLSEEEA